MKKHQSVEFQTEQHSEKSEKHFLQQNIRDSGSEGEECQGQIHFDPQKQEITQTDLGPQRTKRSIKEHKRRIKRQRREDKPFFASKNFLQFDDEEISSIVKQEGAHFEPESADIFRSDFSPFMQIEPQVAAIPRSPSSTSSSQKLPIQPTYNQKSDDSKQQSQTNLKKQSNFPEPKKYPIQEQDSALSSFKDGCFNLSKINKVSEKYLKKMKRKHIRIIPEYSARAEEMSELLIEGKFAKVECILDKYVEAPKQQHPMILDEQCRDTGFHKDLNLMAEEGQNAAEEEGPIPIQSQGQQEQYHPEPVDHFCQNEMYLQSNSNQENQFNMGEVRESNLKTDNLECLFLEEDSIRPFPSQSPKKSRHSEGPDPNYNENTNDSNNRQ